jgi:fructokinase
MSRCPGSIAIVGAIEGGGTKFVCAVGYSHNEVFAEVRIPTTSYEETFLAVLDFFEDAQKRVGNIEAFGIGTFGPIDLDTRSPTWGQLFRTPKPGWTGVSVVAPLRQRFGRPIALDADVNASALAEWQQSNTPIDSLAYITVGTGVGFGAIVNGAPLRGLMHPEMGHVMIRRPHEDVDFRGVCPYHGDCLEGLASGPAVIERWGTTLDKLPDGHPAWQLLGSYLGQAVAIAALTLSSERIVFGGGVMNDLRLLPYVRRAANEILANYLPADHPGDFNQYVTSPMLDTRSGIAGAFELARRALAAPIDGSRK